MKTMRTLEVGDRVKTKAFRDFYGSKRFPIGTIGIITAIDNTQNPSIRVNTNDDCWWYSADEIELVQELSAVEVINILHEICYKHGFLCEGECVLSNHCPLVDAGKNEFNSQKVYAICEQWKADHEKKEPEFEWVDICRIIEVQDNGFKKCVHEVDIKDSELPFGYKECCAEQILKEYMKNHSGNYFATVEHVCRVKGEK